MQRRMLLAATMSALAAPAVRAQQPPFPNRPVTVVVAFSAGGPTDVIARLVAEGMGRDLGQPVVVENVTGAGGTIGAGRVAQAAVNGTGNWGRRRTGSPSGSSSRPSSSAV